MRIPINLATEPFRHDRPMLVASGLCGVLLVALLGLLSFLIVNERSRMKETRATVDRLNTSLRQMTAEQARLDATLRQPANAEVLERSILLNALVERKSISWTRIFADLESVMPHNVRLIQIRLPQINTRNRVVLDMVVGAQDSTPVIDFLKKLEASPLFGPTTVRGALPPTQNEPLYRYPMSVEYAQKL